MGVGGQHHALTALPPGKTQYPSYIRLGGVPGPVWMGAENLAPLQDLIVHGKLIKLCYPGKEGKQTMQEQTYKQASYHCTTQNCRHFEIFSSQQHFT